MLHVPSVWKFESFNYSPIDNDLFVQVNFNVQISETQRPEASHGQRKCNRKSEEWIQVKNCDAGEADQKRVEGDGGACVCKVDQSHSHSCYVQTSCKNMVKVH